MEGILSRIVHKGLHLNGWEQRVKRVAPPPPQSRRGQQPDEQVSQTRALSHTEHGDQAAHSSLAEADRTTAFREGSRGCRFPSSLAERRAPSAQGLMTQWSGHKPKGCPGRIYVSIWEGAELAGTSRCPSHWRNQVWAQDGPYSSTRARPGADRMFTTTSPEPI